jgi:hypothetical protein
MNEWNIWRSEKFYSFKQPWSDYIESVGSSAGRAEDCRVMWLSLGRWFNSAPTEFFYLLFFCLFLTYSLLLFISIFLIYFFLTSFFTYLLANWMFGWFGFRTSQKIMPALPQYLKRITNQESLGNNSVASRMSGRDYCGERGKVNKNMERLWNGFR